MRAFLQTLFFYLLVSQISFAQWVNAGLDGYSIKDIAAQDSIIFAVTSEQSTNYSGKVFRSVDNGTNWVMIVDSCARDIAISPTGKVFMVVKDSMIGIDEWKSLYYSVDNGDSWIRSDIMEQLADSIWRGSPETIRVSPEGIVFCGIWADRPDRFHLDVIAISNDDGLVWKTPGTGVLGGKLFGFRNQFVITYGIIAGIGAGGHDIHLSSDYGNTWTYLGWPPYENSPYLALGFSPNGNIIIGGNEFLLLSSDMCSTWTEIATLNSQVGLSYSSGSSEGMLIGTEDLGVFLFSDEGDSLGSRNEGFINSINIQSLTLDNNGYIYAGLGQDMILSSGGVWRRPLAEIITSVENETTQPINLLLSQNYPNPFNPSTKIKYSVPQSSQVQIKVFDVLGNEVETLVNVEKPIGTYELTWYATNLPSGVYFYQLKAGSFVETKKMILLK